MMTVPTKEDGLECSESRDKLVRSACDAAMQNDAAALCRILRCTSSRSRSLPCYTTVTAWHAPLLNSTKEAQILHQVLFINFNTNLSTPSGGRILRALLMVPSYYETPWTTVVTFLERLQTTTSSSSRIPRASLRSSITELQSFLQQTVSVWWEQERWRHLGTSKTSNNSNSTAPSSTTDKSPRDWILLMTQTIMKSLSMEQEKLEFDESLDDTQSRQPGSTITAANEQEDLWRMPLELVGTLVGTLQDLEQKLFHELLDCIFISPSIRSDRLLPWLTLATDLHAVLRPGDWTNLLQTLSQQQVSNKEENSSSSSSSNGAAAFRQRFAAFSSPQDYPGLMTAIVSLSSTLLLKLRDSGNSQRTQSTSTTRDLFRAWKRIVLNLLYAASADPDTFCTVITVFQERLSGLPSESLQEWICGNENDTQAVELGDTSTTGGPPKWIEANMTLAVMKSARTVGSSMVDRILLRALPNSKGIFNVAFDGWKALMVLATNNGTTTHTAFRKKVRKTPQQKSWVPLVEKTLKGLFYTGGGRFKDTENVNNDISLCNQVGELVYHSLFLKLDEQAASSKTTVFYVVDRAQDWVDVATARLKSQDGALFPREVLMIAVIVITIFIEVPLSRSFIVRGIAQSLQGEIDVFCCKRDIALLNSWLVAVLVRSQCELALLNPIIDVLAAGKLEKPVFLALAQAIVPASSSAQQAILCLSRKRLGAFFGGTLWSGEMFDKNTDRTQCSLCCLCMLIQQPNWSDNSAEEAWKVLSEVLVLNRPVLPVAARTWLFHEIQELLDSKKLSSMAVTRLRRACLLRLLQFVDNDSNDGKSNLDARSIFMIWRTQDAQSVQCTNVEDIPGLYRLVFSLFFHQTVCLDVAESDDEILQDGYSYLLRSCSANAAAATDDTFAIKREPEQSLHSSLTVLLARSAIGFISNLLGSTDNDSRLGTFSFDPSFQKAELISREESSVGQRSLRPSWLDQMAQSRHQTNDSTDPPLAAVQLLAVSLCSTIAGFLKDHRWSRYLAKRPSLPRESQHRQLLASLSFFAKARKCLSQDDETFEKAVAEKFLSNATSAATQKEVVDMGAFFFASASFVHQAISAKLNLSEMSLAFSVIVESLTSLRDAMCDFGHTLSEFEMDLLPLLRGLWVFYEQVCDEEASVRLIAYLEGSIEAKEQSGELLNTIRSADEVDAEVRHVRYKVLSTLHECLEFSLKLRAGQKMFTVLPFLQQIDVFWSDCHKHPIEFLLVVVAKLVDDLQSGLEGESGGISTAMYMAYIDTLNDASNLIVQQIENYSQVSTLRSIHFQCREVLLKLQSVFCSFPPEKKAPFGKAFLLISRAIPHMAKCAARGILLSEEEHEAFLVLDELNSEFQGMSFGVSAFENCTSTWKRWNKHDPTFLSSWTKAKVPEIEHDDHSSLLDEESAAKQSTHSPAYVESQLIPSVVSFPSQLTNKGQDGYIVASTNRNGVELPIQSKDVWTWTASCSLLSMETAWLDATAVMIHRQFSSTFCACQFPLHASALAHIRHRFRELSGICEALRPAFVTPVDERTGADRSGKEVDTKAAGERLLAETFSDEVQQRLCSLMYRIVAATDVSIKVAHTVIQRMTASPSTLSLAEALSCLLVFCATKEYNPFDLFLGFRKWYDAEKRNHQKLPVDTVGRRVLRYFSRVLICMEKLESSFSKLVDKLASNLVCKDSVRALDEVFVAMRTSDFDVDVGGSFYAMIKARSEKLKQAQCNLQKDGTVTSRLISSQTRKRKRNKELRRQPVRSRNTTVDQWLRSDQFMEDEVDDGAYLDLEDFVAEG